MEKIKMRIEQFHSDTKGFFKATENGLVAGNMTYSRAGNDRIIIDHTDVKPHFRGKNVGNLMLMAAVEYARENHIKIIPLCPFARSVFDKTPEIRDVL